jgi:hypothetical protein
MLTNSEHLHLFLSSLGNLTPILKRISESLAYCCLLRPYDTGVGSCTKPVAHPESFVINCDGSLQVKDLKWSQWSESSATAAGIAEIDNCVPYCAAGRWRSDPVKMTLATPMWDQCMWVFQTIELTFIGPHPRGQRALRFNGFSPPC